jgi:hypothetical protein
MLGVASSRDNAANTTRIGKELSATCNTQPVHLDQADSVYLQQLGSRLQKICREAYSCADMLLLVEKMEQFNPFFQVHRSKLSNAAYQSGYAGA